MPKLYEYLGIVLFFSAREHKPIHVHAQFNDTAMKIEFVISQGIIVEVKYKKIKGWEPIPSSKMKDLTKLIDKYKEDIIEKWIHFFDLNYTEIKTIKINKKLK